MRPLLAVDPQAISASIVAAEALLEESKSEFDESALFLFFHGRVYRLKVYLFNVIITSHSYLSRNS